MFEIERKFLLKELPDLSKLPFDEIEQGYLSFAPEIRIRKKEEKYFITKKSEGTKIREEIEISIDHITFEILSSLVQKNLVKKTRYKITLDNGIIAELDIYHEQLEGLVVVETEFPSNEEAEKFVAPTWFGKDITEDKRYKNKNLAQIDNIELLTSTCDLNTTKINAKKLTK